MTFSVLSTKLNKPQLPDSLISRDTLLKDCDWASVILVSAQAGSGKSTAVSAWLSEQSKAYCWYSLDDWDNDLMQFLAYLINGLKTIDALASENLRQLVDAYQSIGFEAFIRALVNQLHAIKSPYILILDDYHVIRNDQINIMMRTILEHFPPSMQLVLITREDPPFPLAKMRAAKKLLELRTAQLRFTEEEARVFFARQLHVSLAKEQLQNLTTRTEGWIAGLQMTALSMQGIDDVGSFVVALAGSHYYIMDYLMEEVLERQMPEIKEFLLKTSILEFFSADLCDAVVQFETGSSSTIIERLVKTNSFIISTESSHEWFRYHHLFRDLLKKRLEQRSKRELESLHHRAGLWFKMNGFGPQAIHHLLQANYLEEAAALIECKWAEMDMQMQSASWLDLAKRLPSTILERSPVLTMGYGWALLDMGDVKGCIGWFDQALRLYNLAQTHDRPADIIIKDKTQFGLLPATIASARAYIAGATGDIEAVFTHTRYALERIPSDQYVKRSVVEMLLALAHWGSGDLDEAESVILRLLKDIKKAAHPLVENSYYMVLGELYIQKGALSKAQAIFEQTISRLVAENLVPIMLPSLYLGLAKIAFLQSENKQAYALLEESKTHGQRYALMNWKYNYYLLLARLYGSEGLYDLARGCINEGRTYYYFNPIPEDISIEDVEKQIETAASQHQNGRFPGIKDENATVFWKEHVNQSLSEPLTVRELEVLGLIVSGLSNQEICDTLFLALSTVKGYVQNIFGKLAVKRRTQAAAKAKELGLV